MASLAPAKWSPVGVSLLFALIGGVLGISSPIRAETQLRVEAESKFRPVEPLTLTPSAQLRLGPSLARADSLLSGLAVRYQFLPELSLGTGYRFNYDRNQEGDFRAKQRIVLELAGKLKADAWSVKARVRVQEQWRKTRKGETRHRPSLRNLLQLKWQLIPQLAPFASVEHFLALEKLASTQTRKWRLGLGVQWAVAAVELHASYRQDIAIAEEEGETAHIVTVGISL